MAPVIAKRASASKTSPSKSSKAKTSTKKTSTLTLGKVPVGSVVKKTTLIKPITQFVKPVSISSTSTGGTPAPAAQYEDKGKQKEVISDVDDQLWVDQYGPMIEADLAVHKRKVEDVRRWLLEALDGGKLRKYRRLLVLTGPAGAGKTATLRVLAKELDAEIVEWRNGQDDLSQGDSSEYESLALKFQNFLDRASSYRSLSFSSGPSPSSSRAKTTPQSTTNPLRQLILLEDLPNILHSATRDAFQSALTAFATSAEIPSCPLVIVISDSGVRGESKDERGGYGAGGSGQDETVDARSVIPPGILNGPYCTHVPFNPIAPTLMRKAVNALLTRVASSSTATSHQKPSKEVVDIIVESANGDIRSAIMALQFACIVDLPSGKGKGKTKSGKKGKEKGVKSILEAITQREQSLVLFHLLGKLLYNKRYGDPEEEEDAPYRPLKLPGHLRKEHGRRLSKVDANALYADSPVDTSLVSLYVHQNYTQFCETVEECEGIMANLSAVDGLYNGDLWPLNAALLPHSFQMLTLGTLHSLPSPVIRRGQKTYKPDFFESLSRGREADGAVADARVWLDSLSGVKDDMYAGVGAWSKRMVVLEAPGLLKARSRGANARPPPNHISFSTFDIGDDPTTSSKHRPQVAEEDDTGETDLVALKNEDEDYLYAARPIQKEAESHGWLSDDEIDEI